jgi:hypothetical protein
MSDTVAEKPREISDRGRVHCLPLAVRPCNFHPAGSTSRISYGDYLGQTVVVTKKFAERPRSTLVWKDENTEQ